MIDLSKLSNVELYPAVNSVEIDRIESEMGLKLPKVFKELLYLSNGFVTDDGIAIFGTDIIAERNLTYEVPEYAEGYIAVGSNGGGKFLLMLANEESTQLLQVDCGVMNPEYATLVTTDFSEWINEGAKSFDLIEEIKNKEQLYNLVLVEQPKGGAQDLKKIQECYSIKTGLFDLLKGSKKLPFTMMKNISLNVAKKNLESLGELGKILKIIPSDMDTL
ncbi:SMI1/KNR4 family protein [Ruminiclostridium cellulolyticum]|uniref:SMI1 / KNR4 family n=1 Tax=Ruminiclostridium cellulolyticum (strain ATCC 35319 / DSM 5812 / JCM 6584 / H10) TaxID=394503 RepID=B8I5J3_RUMCH|nr:SMI1/KNR4 family protein [Ruminiclostridium cellulolyticum]ACL76729.1 SMI1 / KNR4 family [Ruminiclostridium cellulolyticum H10]